LIVHSAGTADPGYELPEYVQHTHEVLSIKIPSFETSSLLLGQT